MTIHGCTRFSSGKFTPQVQQFEPIQFTVTILEQENLSTI